MNSEILENAFDDCDVSNIENKIKFLRKLILNQNKDYFADTKFPSKIDNGTIKTKDLSLYIKNLKTSLSNNVLKEIIEKENVCDKNETVQGQRARFKKKEMFVVDNNEKSS